MKILPKWYTFQVETGPFFNYYIHTDQFFFIQKERIRSDFEPLFDGNGSSRPVSKGYKDFCNKWGWYKTIADLAEDKIHLFDTITRKTVGEVFGFLLYKIDKSHAEEDQYKFERQMKR